MQQAPIENATKQTGRPRLTRQKTAEKHGEWYRLFLMGWSSEEISQAFSVNRSSVHRAVEEMRQGQSWTSRTARQRFSDLVSEIYDGARLASKESWRQYLQLAKDGKLEVAARFLARAQSSLMVLARLVPDQHALWIEEQLQMLEGNQAKIREFENEKRLKERVHPIA
jgi:hypothetical protein